MALRVTLGVGDESVAAFMALNLTNYWYGRGSLDIGLWLRKFWKRFRLLCLRLQVFEFWFEIYFNCSKQLG